MNRLLSKLLLFVLAIALCGCHREANVTHRGIYYWRTTFNLSEQEQLFLQNHQIDRMYLHLFDIDVAQQNLWTPSCPQPIATILFPSKDDLNKQLQSVNKCIPTVFITQEALRMMENKEDEYARKIFTRVLNMCSYHGFDEKVHEVQLDCDWTANTQESYFKLLDSLHQLLKEKGIQLSATIRLHQLRTAAPPVDRGALMIYNTGSFRHIETGNSILTYEQAAMYLQNYEYPLELDYAFPTFQWGIWFRDNKFMAILHCSDYSDSTLYQQQDSTHFVVLKSHANDGHWIKQGDIIRFETSDVSTIEEVKTLLHFPEGETNTLILYHLDENNLNKFTDHEIETLYTRIAAE